jgi:hypothetical protein
MISTNLVEAQSALEEFLLLLQYNQYDLELKTKYNLLKNIHLISV